MTVHQVMTDPELISRAEKLENALSNGNLIDFCHYKMCEHKDNENISKAWSLIAIHLESDRQKQKDCLLEALGFGPKNDSIENLCDLTNSQLSTQVMSNEIRRDSLESYGTEFIRNENSVNNWVESQLPDSLTVDTSDTTLGNQINRGILSGRLESVIQSCIQNKNWTEAILLCCFVSPEHTASTLKQYLNYCLTSKPDSWSPLLWCIITAQTSNEEESVQIFEEFISKVELKYWRQVLAFIIRESENWEDVNTKAFLINSLGKRLVDNYVDSGVKEWLDAGIYCFIINGDYINISKFVPFGSHLDRIEMSLILQKCTNSEFVANQLTAHFAKLLAIEGKLDLALKYIDDNEFELKDRIIGNLKPITRRFSTQTQAVAPIVQKTFNRSPVYSNLPTKPIPKPIQNMSVQQPMPPNASLAYPQPSLTPALSANPYLPTGPMGGSVGPPQPMYGMSQNNTSYNPYGNQSYADQQYTPQPVTPGWNDPPVLTTSRRNSFSAHLNEGHPHNYNQMATNPISTPLPVIPSQKVEPHIREMSQNRSNPVPPPSEPLSPQNQQIMDAFDRLISQLQHSIHSQPLNTKRKLEDSRLKLESLRSKLGSSSQLSSNTISGLTQIANAINRNDFQTALSCHTNLVASTTFGETTAFLPSIKVVLHLAQQRIQ